MDKTNSSDDHKHDPRHDHDHSHKHDHDHDHDHSHGHHHGPGIIHHHSTLKNLKVALILNVGFALIELFGGIWTGSLAIVADAIHDFGDASALGLALLFEYLATRKPSGTFTYGYRRLSLMSAATTAIFLLVGSLLVIFKSVERLQEPTLPHLPGMLGLALLGIAVNGYAAFRLRSGATLNERVVSWHLLEDVLGWVAVLLGTILMMIFKIPQIDAYLSLGFSLFIIWSVSKQFYRTLRLFLQATPDGIDQKKMRLTLSQVKDVKKIHDMHFWSLDGVSHVLTAHVVVADSFKKEDCIRLKKDLRHELAHFGHIHSTIEIEWSDETCSMVGENCHDPD